MGFIQWLSATAVSFTISGNTGIAPFMSLFLVGLIEKTNPDLLYMDGTIEWLLSSWLSIIFLGILCILEFVGKCVPVVDEIIDSALTFVIPIFSIMGSLSTFGLFTIKTSEGGDEYDMMNMMGDDYGGGGDDDGQERRRQLVGSVASAGLVFFQIFVVGIGIILALCLHCIKMITRLIGEGCLTNCITVLEYMWIGFSITLAIFIRQVAVCIAILFCFLTAYIVKRRYVDNKSVEEIAKEDSEAVIRRTTATMTSIAVDAAIVVSADVDDALQGDDQQQYNNTSGSQQDFVMMTDDEEQPKST